MDPPAGSVALVADMAVEAHRVDRLRALELPGIAEGEPVLGPLHLPAIVEALLEQAVLVADPVAVGRDAERGHAVEQAGGEPAEAAIAQRGVGLDLEHLLGVHPECRERGRGGVVDAEIAQGIGEQAADQELEAEIVDPLAAALVGLARARHPAVDQPVAHRERQGDEPVVPGGGLRVLADLVD
jgi:hypothetical protein